MCTTPLEPLGRTERRLRISAHTDAPGDPNTNLSLSARRANAVAAYLMELGARSGRPETKAFGELRPIASNDTREGRLANRRVELDLMR